jgi:hypothetical protein
MLDSEVASSRNRSVSIVDDDGVKQTISVLVTSLY